MRKKNYIGIDLGHHTLKVVQIERQPQGWKVVRVGVCPTPSGAIREGVVVDVPTLAAALRQLIKNTGITSKYGVVSVQGGSVVVRTVRIPQMTEAVLRKSIRYEVGRYIPTSVEDSYVEFEITNEKADETQMEVLIVAAPKDLVESRLSACALAGIDVEVVDIGPFAAYRSLVEMNDLTDTQDETLAMIDFGANNTTVSVICKGNFVLTRTVQNGSANLTEALKTFFDLTSEDAEAGKAQLNVGDLLEESPKENPPLRVLHPYIDELVREIRRSINYYESQQTDGTAPTPVSKVVLTGGGAKMTGIDRYLSDKLGISVESTGVFDNPRVLNFTPTELGNGADFTVASGLAMRPWLRAS